MTVTKLTNLLEIREVGGMIGGYMLFHGINPALYPHARESNSATSTENVGRFSWAVHPIARGSNLYNHNTASIKQRVDETEANRIIYNDSLGKKPETAPSEIKENEHTQYTEYYRLFLKTYRDQKILHMNNGFLTKILFSIS